MKLRISAEYKGIKYAWYITLDQLEDYVRKFKSDDWRIIRVSRLD